MGVRVCVCVGFGKQPWSTASLPSFSPWAAKFPGLSRLQPQYQNVQMDFHCTSTGQLEIL